MKKFLSVSIALALALTLAACGQITENEGPSTGSVVSSENGPTSSAGSSALEASSSFETTESVPNTETSSGASDKTVLVAYFSWSGNTEKMASYIAEQTGGDLLEIHPETPYPTDYNECGDVALAERDNDERPAISNPPESIDEYDIILIGYPIWWHTAPMIIGTFLESYDLTGKAIYPFTQSASMNTEQFDNSIAFVRENADGATVYDGLFANPSDTEAIDAYLLGNGLVQ